MSDYAGWKQDDDRSTSGKSAGTQCLPETIRHNPPAGISERQCRARHSVTTTRQKRKPRRDCEPVLQSKEQERKPPTYSGARPTSIPIKQPST
jgi:hypothetical protein